MSLLATACSGTKEQPAPNVLFILCDDLGYGDLGVYGQQAKVSGRIFDQTTGSWSASQESLICTTSRQIRQSATTSPQSIMKPCRK